MAVEIPPFSQIIKRQNNTMNIIDFLSKIGIETPSFIAGMSGGITFLTKRKDMTWIQRFLTVMSGGFTANYLTPLVAIYLHLDEKALYGIAFLLGYTGMKSVEMIIIKVKNRINFKTNLDDTK